jgi:hypothetical protein
MVVISTMADVDDRGAMNSPRAFARCRESFMVAHQDPEKEIMAGLIDGVGGFNVNNIGNLQISVVEGRNFQARGDGQTFRPSVELQIGDHKV